MNNFLVTYASGLKAEISSGLESVELFCNEHFGSTWGVAKENGATVDMVEAGDLVETEAMPVSEIVQIVNIEEVIETINVIPSIPMTPTEPPAEVVESDKPAAK